MAAKKMSSKQNALNASRNAQFHSSQTQKGGQYTAETALGKEDKKEEDNNSLIFN